MRTLKDFDWLISISSICAGFYDTLLTFTFLMVGSIVIFFCSDESGPSLFPGFPLTQKNNFDQ